MVKQFFTLVACVLLLGLTGCGSSPPVTTTATQYRADGKVLASWKVSNYWTSGSCLAFQVLGEPTASTFTACGDVAVHQDNNKPTDAAIAADSPASYQVTQFARDGRTVLGSWSATSVSPSNGCIRFWKRGGNAYSTVCGNVLAEALTGPPSLNSPAPYRVAMFDSDGHQTLSWKVQTLGRSDGLVTFYVAGASSSQPNYVAGTVQAGVMPD